MNANTSKGHIPVKISEKQGSVTYIEHEEQDEGADHRGHASQQFLRFQEISNDYWSTKHYYMLCCILIATGDDIFPMTMNLALQLSGGSFLIMLLCSNLTVGLPLLYMETFLGRYTRLTNSQMYRMAPICFGLCLTIFFINFLHQPLKITSQTQLLVNLLKLLVNPHMNDKCLDDSGSCYEYRTKGSLVNDSCRYGYVSMICKLHGEIRYPLEYQYWKMYKDPTSSLFPYYQIITAVVITWVLILVIVMKGLETLGWIVQVSFVMQMIATCLIFILALTRDGGTKGLQVLITVDLSEIDIYQIFTVIWHSMATLGIIIPTGCMTFSAYARFSTNWNSMGTDCMTIVASSVVISAFYLAVFFAICGVLAQAIGVDLPTVFVRGRGIYLAVVPEFIVLLRIPNIMLILYYATVWFFELTKRALYVHMVILNFYDYFPTIKNFTTYIWIASCIVMCFISIPTCTQYISLEFIPVLYLMYQKFVLGILITLEATMVFYLYGVERLCEDIHFMTGRTVMNFWKVTWYLIPAIGWYNIFLMAYTSDYLIMNTEYEKVQKMSYDGWLYAYVVYWGLLVTTVVSTIMHVIFRFGTPNLLLALIKPQYFWGPPNKDLRTDRKNFCPKVSILSQNIYDKYKEDYDVPAASFPQRLFETVGDRGDVMRDKIFFDRIGVLSPAQTTNKDNVFSQNKERELDVQDTNKK